MKNIIRFLFFVKPYTSKIFIGLLFMAGVSLTNLPLPSIIRLVIDRILKEDIISLTLGNQTYYFPALTALTYIFILIVIIYLLRAVFIFCRNNLMNVVAHRVVYDLRYAIFQHLQKLSLRYFETQSTGKIMAKITSDVDAIYALTLSTTIDLVTDLLTLLIVISILLVMNVKLALISFLILPVFGLNYWRLVHPIHKLSRKIRKKWSEIYGDLQETIAGVKVVKSFTGEKYELDNFNEDLEDNYTAHVKLGRLGSLLGSASEFLSALGTALILWIGGREVITGKFTAGAVVAFYGYLGMLYTPLVRLLHLSDVITRASASLDHIFELLDTEPEIKDLPTATALPQIKGRITFDRVSFAYEPNRICLDNISFTALPGTRVALVGPSGAGKTTVTNLIARFYDPVDGNIIVDEYDIRYVKLISLRNQIGMVLQESFLFSGTVKENLLYGNQKATEKEIYTAAQTANAHEFILQLPQGYDTELGERGVKLSVGQKQRIAIARALLRNPRILILDEATSSLDSESESLIQEALERLISHRTCIVIAHRLSTILKADKILVLNQGRLVEEGTHNELVVRNGLYSRLYDEQFKHQIKIN